MKPEEYYEVICRSKPVLKYCERFDENSDKWNFTKHSHSYIELIFYLEGKAGVEVGGYYIDASIYDTIVHPANCMHLDDLSGERKREIICLGVDIPELVIERSLLLHERSSELRDLFQMIFYEEKRKEQDPYIMEYLLKALLTIVMRQAQLSEDSNRFLREVIPYIHEHFSEKITLDELAELEHISKSYLLRRFKQYTGMTIISYINHVRVETAKQLLIDSDCNVSEIAYQVGFESPKYFHRVFKSETGEPPAAFRKAYKTNEKQVK